jgi:hypothetical protein
MMGDSGIKYMQATGSIEECETLSTLAVSDSGTVDLHEKVMSSLLMENWKGQVTVISVLYMPSFLSSFPSTQLVFVMHCECVWRMSPPLSVYWYGTEAKFVDRFRFFNSEHFPL